MPLKISNNFLICNACGVQYPVTDPSKKDECRICDDPRQFVPPSGQSFTTLAKLKAEGHHNIWWQDERHPNIWFIRTEPKFAISQRAMLIQTPAGNILWDLFTYLDQETVDKIEDMGGLKCIVISHPHYYSTWADWSRTFKCPVYVGGPDKEWLERVGEEGSEADVRFLDQEQTDILPGSGATAILAGGHFPGSLLLHWEKVLFIADTIIMSPSALNPAPGKPGVTSFGFFYSIPNRIPLHPDDVLMIWNKAKKFDFDTCLGAFDGHDIYTLENELQRGTGGVKGRLLQSCKIFVNSMGWPQHPIMEQTL